MGPDAFTDSKGDRLADCVAGRMVGRAGGEGFRQTDRAKKSGFGKAISNSLLRVLLGVLCADSCGTLPHFYGIARAVGFK